MRPVFLCPSFWVPIFTNKSFPRHFSLLVEPNHSIFTPSWCFNLEMFTPVRVLIGLASFSFVIYASPLSQQLDSRAPTAVSGWTYSGCFKETSGGRALDGNSLFSDTMTVQICATFCTNNGFDIFGVEYGRECFCGTTLRRDSLPAPETDCSTPCRGKASDTCGNGDSKFPVVHHVRSPKIF